MSPGGLLLPLIGCWMESGAEGAGARFLFGLSGNLVVRRGEASVACESVSQWSEADDEGVRRLRLNSRWSLVENTRTHARYLLFKGEERFALPACSAGGVERE